MKEEYGVNFYKGFDLCLNALDNRAARNHVNRDANQTVNLSYCVML